MDMKGYNDVTPAILVKYSILLHECMQYKWLCMWYNMGYYMRYYLGITFGIISYCFSFIDS